jgi:4-aminobutyrate aminotransferase-like enzyme
MEDLADILRRGFDEYGKYVNPLIERRAQLTGEPLRVVRTDRGRLVTDDGRIIEDFHGTQAFGHRNAAITQALQAFLATDAPTWYPSRVSPHAGRFARRLCERSGYTHVYFGGTGSDAVEAALKLARAATRRPRLLGLSGAYHGCGFGSTALMDSGPFRDPFGPNAGKLSSTVWPTRSQARRAGSRSPSPSRLQLSR